jgi:hypothetical protein
MEQRERGEAKDWGKEEGRRQRMRERGWLSYRLKLKCKFRLTLKCLGNTKSNIYGTQERVLRFDMKSKFYKGRIDKF